MKSLSLRTFHIGEQEVKYIDLLKTCLNQAPKEGLDPETMRKRIKVLDALEASTDKLELEDAEAETLKACVAEMRWALLNKEILNLCDAVKAM